MNFEHMGRYLFFILMIFSSVRINAQVRVNLVTPTLGSGMSQLEALLVANVGTAASEIETMLNETLHKPELTSSFGKATGLCSSISMMGNIPQFSKYSISIGANASLYSSTLDFEAISSKLVNLQPDDDFQFGIGVQGVNVNFSIPLTFLIEELSFLGSIGYLNISTNEYSISDFSALFSLGYSVFDEIEPSRSFKWNPLSIQIGISYGYNNLGTTIDGGVISETFEADPDSDGPLLPQSVSVELEPLIDIGLESQIGTVLFSLSSGISIFDSFHLFLGGGLNLMFGKTGISVYSEEEITVVGYLSELVEEEGSIKIGGSVSGGSVSGGSPTVLLPYCYSGLQVDFSSSFINLTVLLNPKSGISGGISIGVSL